MTEREGEGEGERETEIERERERETRERERERERLCQKKLLYVEKLSCFLKNKKSKWARKARDSMRNQMKTF